ncbi:hypothetical protein [Asaia sp. As-1742]|uniref:hypothetical protein n=1 Tax=Asaia sp. As-1742 TaxID=2608325 RepID=UPI00351A12F7
MVSSCGRNLGDSLPIGESGGSGDPVIGGGEAMTAKLETAMDENVAGEKALGLAW